MKSRILAALVLSFLMLPAFAEPTAEEQAQKLNDAIETFYYKCVATGKVNSKACKTLYEVTIMTQAGIPCTASSPVSGAIAGLE